MEHTVRECEELVQRVSTFVMLSLERGRCVAPELKRVHAVDRLVMEVNNARSFEGYLAWAPLTEIVTIVGDLESVGLTETAWIVRLALRTGFPHGFPSTEAERERAIASWTDAQRAALEGLADYMEDPGGDVVRGLAKYVLALGEEVAASPSARLH
jgi:hypothetical protein